MNVERITSGTATGAVTFYGHGGIGTFICGECFSDDFIGGGNWIQPSGSYGSGHWIRFTETGTSGTNTQYVGDTLNTWHQIGTSKEVRTNLFSPTTDAGGNSYLVEIATDAAGTNIVSSRTITINLFLNFSGVITP